MELQRLRSRTRRPVKSTAASNAFVVKPSQFARRSARMAPCEWTSRLFQNGAGRWLYPLVHKCCAFARQCEQDPQKDANEVAIGSCASQLLLVHSSLNRSSMRRKLMTCCSASDGSSVDSRVISPSIENVRRSSVAAEASWACLSLSTTRVSWLRLWIHWCCGQSLSIV